jgi:hypothetical protein
LTRLTRRASVDLTWLERARVGALTHDRGTLRFVYDPEWLKNSQAFALDPEQSLDEGTYFPNAEAGQAFGSQKHETRYWT